MKIFLALLCSLALAFVANGAQEKKEEEKPAPKKQAQTTQVAKPSGGGPKASAGGPHQQTTAQEKKKEEKPAPKKQAQTTRVAKPSGTAKAGRPHQQTNASQRTTEPQRAVEAGKGKAKRASQTNAAAGQPVGGGPQKTKEKKGVQPAPAAAGRGAAGEQAAGKTKQGKANVAQAKSKPIKPQHFNISKRPNTAKAPPVKFQQGRRIQGSQNWQGQSYTVFRTYSPAWHDQGWWHSHYNNIVWAFGAPYYWNAGYWFPAWGYTPNAYYAWDGPIYAYNNLPPDQVIANVQATLQQQGYYHGDVDGLIGPLTRAAIADYQRDHGLYITSAIDQPTLQSLGMA